MHFSSMESEEVTDSNVDDLNYHEVAEGKEFDNRSDDSNQSGLSQVGGESRMSSEYDDYDRMREDIDRRSWR